MNLPSHLPASFNVTIAESRNVPVLPTDALVSGSAIALLGEESLSSIARPGMRVTIAFTDSTRYSPDKILVGYLLRELFQAGVQASDINLLVATGLHRPMTRDEAVAKLGTEIAESFQVINHDALNPETLVDLGTIDGIPVIANHFCVECDLLLATGVVEPHQYAGYSGGAKTVVIGCGGEATIQVTHGANMLDRAGTRLGAIDVNPFQQFVRSAGERIGLAFVANVLLNEQGEVIAAAAGPYSLAHEYLVKRGREVYEVPIQTQADIAIAGVNPAKAANLYQASRAATYLALSAGCPLRRGAPIILPASIPEGAGEGTGEKRFLEAFRSAASPAALLKELRATGFPAGAQRAYILASVLVNHPIIVVGAMYPDIVESCFMSNAPDLDSALALAVKLSGKSEGSVIDLLAVPNALVTLPTYEPEDAR